MLTRIQVIVPLLLLATAVPATSVKPNPPPFRPRLPNWTPLLPSAVAASALLVGAPVEPAAAALSDILTGAQRNSMVTYSSNARNFQRLGEGDSSAGSVYTNDLPDGSPAAKRRALVGCKSARARQEVASSLSEKDCNMRIISGGETKFMLDALKVLECPTCAYGIGD